MIKLEYFKTGTKAHAAAVL